MTDVDVVLIGRNEGERLVRSLASLKNEARRIFYVDSGSTDNSVQAARDAGAEVIDLDLSIPFTAARARNAGFAAMMRHDDPPEFVQFLDGDCRMTAGWLAAASRIIAADDSLALVTGWQSEIHRDRTLYNQLFDFEWHGPVGDINACGGNMMVRVSAFEKLGGFNPNVIAAEDDEFCTRLRKDGWRLIRVAEDMSGHDADVTRFGQWWKRAERTGHGFAQVGHIHPDYFVKERLRGWAYGLVLPLIALIGAAVSLWIPILMLAIYAASYAKTTLGLVKNELPVPEAMAHAVLLTLSKFPNVIGMLRYHWRRINNAEMRIIEYK